MATMTKAPKKAASTEKTGQPRISGERKREILGIIMMAVAVLFSLSLATYSPSDRLVIQELSAGGLLHPGQEAENRLGIVGAVAADTLVHSFLGYNTLLLSALALAWGYVVFRGRRPVHLPFVSAVGFVAAFQLACSFGWVAHTFDLDLHAWSGMWGLGTARWLQQIFGTVGSAILLVVSAVVLGLLSVSGDLQGAAERVENGVRTAKGGANRWLEGREARRAERELDTRNWDDLSDEEGPAPEPRLVRSAKKEPEPAPPPARPEMRVQRPAKESMPTRPRVEESTLPEVEEADSAPVRMSDLFRETPVRPAAPPPRPVPAYSPEARGDGAGPALKVVEQVEEEKSDNVERETEVSKEDRRYGYVFPPIDLLEEVAADEKRIDYDELEENKQVLLDKLETYNIEITEINAIVGPTVTMYELTPAPGIKISRITSLSDDLAMAMAARGIRMIAPIPGKSAIGVEIPNRHREMVRIRDLIATTKFRDTKMELPVAIGKSVEGEVYLEDLTKMPHLLIAGATGSGKSVGVNTLIASLLYACHPGNLKFVMIDPKKIELQQYARVVDHYGALSPLTDEPIITDFTEALGVLKSCEKEMERRYDLLSKATVRGIKDYNKKVHAGQLRKEEGHEHLPYIVVIVDELADLMMTAGKDIEGPIARLAQMARAVGIHLVLATQRPSVDVITGLIKANFPSRMAYQVASKVDSRTILDQNGAEQLVGNGDLLYMNGSRLVRLQGPYIDIEEVEEITNHIAAQHGPGPYMLPTIEADPEEFGGDLGSIDDIDDLFDEAARIIVRSQQGSVSLLQRKLSVGYTRAARIVDQLEEAGIVGPFEGSKARAVLVEDEIVLDQILAANKNL